MLDSLIMWLMRPLGEFLGALLFVATIVGCVTMAACLYVLWVRLLRAARELKEFMKNWGHA